MLTIECGPAKVGGVCDCCGGMTTTLTRFVHKDGDAHAVYLAKFSDNHPEHVAGLVIGLGEWGSDTVPSNRVAFAMSLQVCDEEWEVSVVDGTSSGWSNTQFLGRLLSRAEALSHPLLADAFQITDSIVVDDNVIASYFGRGVGDIDS